MVFKTDTNVVSLSEMYSRPSLLFVSWVLMSRPLPTTLCLSTPKDAMDSTQLSTLHWCIYYFMRPMLSLGKVEAFCSLALNKG